MELETKRFYEVSARRTTDAGVRQLLGISPRKNAATPRPPKR